MITDYLPAPETISATDVFAARVRLASFIKEWWPDLDTRPNSVFGDLSVSPLAVLQAGMEQAGAAFQSDVNLANVAAGIIFNPDFVEAYLANFGVSSRESVPSSGSLRLVFNTNKAYAIDADTAFSFNNLIFKINPDEGNPLIIHEVGSQERRVLVRTGESEYTVFLPVTGTPGAIVQNGDDATYLLSHPEVVSVTAAGDFDPGSNSESLPALARRAIAGFGAAHFCSRAGVLSFVSQTWPNMVACSPVLAGDKEMIRSGANILGLIDGAIDIYTRSKPSYTFGESILPLTWDAERQGWVGELRLPVVPAFYSLNTGVFQVGNFNNNRGINTLYAKSNHPVADNLGVAFSKYETLGILVEDNQPQNVSEAVIQNITETTGSGSQLSVTGQYAGNIFSTLQGRSVSLRTQGLVEIDGYEALSALVRDEVTLEAAIVYFIPDQLVSPTFGQLKQDDLGYQTMFNGLEIQLRTAGGTWDLAALANLRFVFNFKGRTAEFTVDYLYDPLLTSVDAAVNDSDHRPVQTSLFAKSFLPCYLDQFIVNYRVRAGQVVDLENARTDIFNYLNTLGWPEVYDESKIGAILTSRGAAGLGGVQKRGIFYPSLASYYVDKQGQQTTVPRYLTNTLIPPDNDFGLGARNVSYILAIETIQFNATVF